MDPCGPAIWGVLSSTQHPCGAGQTGTGREEGLLMLLTVCKCQGREGEGRQLEQPQQLMRGDSKN